MRCQKQRRGNVPVGYAAGGFCPMSVTGTAKKPAAVPNAGKNGTEGNAPCGTGKTKNISKQTGYGRNLNKSTICPEV